MPTSVLIGEGEKQRALTGLAIASITLTVASCAGADGPSTTDVPAASTPGTATTLADTTAPPTATAPDNTVSPAPTSAPTTTIGVADVAPAVADVLFELGDARIAAFGGVACAEEVIGLTIAAELHLTNTGETPTSLGQLTPLLVEPPALWTWERGDRLPEPVPGSGCSTDGFDPPPDEADQNICTLERRTIEIAVDAYVALNPSAANPDETDLVGSFLDEPSTLWDVDDGTIVAAPGSPCE